MNTAKPSCVPATRPVVLPLSGQILPVCVSKVLGRGAKAVAAMLALALFGGGVAQAATTGWNQTGVGPFDYNDQANWVGGNINGLFDVSVSIPSSQTVTFGADTVLSTGLTFNYEGSSNETLRGTGANRTLTLGGDIVVNTVSNSRTVNFGSSTNGQFLNVDLGGVTRTFTVGSGRSLGFVNAISNGGIVAFGGTINFSGANTYTGATVLNTGTMSLNGSAGSSAFSDFTVNGGRSGTTTLTFNGSSGSGTTRAKSVTLAGGGSSTVVLSVNGNAAANTVETITNALTAGSGISYVTLSPNAARNTRLEAGSFSRADNTTILLRGTNLGVNAIDSAVAGSVNIRFSSVPLAGGGGAVNQPNIGIIKGAYGDLSGSGSGAGLVTHDSVNGVRLLNSSEYVNAIADGGAVLNNVLYARTSADPAADITLTTALTTINSLSFRITGAGGAGAGVIIGGDIGTSLRVNSGVIFASQTLTGTTATTDAMLISVPTLDLNGQEGVFIANTPGGMNQGNTSAPLRINSNIANDGGKGVTIGGTGQVIFSGSEVSTYTGPTVVNSGILRLDKTVNNASIPGDLVLNGGSILKRSNAIPDSATVTLNGGTFWFDSSFSSGNDGHQETFQNLIMNGGSVGHHGENAALTITGNATVSFANLTMNQGGDLTVNGLTTLNGGLLTARESFTTTTESALTSINQLAIVNQPSGAYTAVSISGHDTNKGGKLLLTGDVTFTGNATNLNSVTIDTSNIALLNQGRIALRGTRTFDIGNGAAATDLVIVPAITNDDANVGGIDKIGAGTLALNGANLFTGPTNVNIGTLIVGGSLTGTSSISVAATGILGTDASANLTLATDGGISLGGTIAPGGESTVGLLTATLSGAGKLTFLSGSKLALDLALLPASSDLFAFGSAGDWLAGSGLGLLQLGGTIDYGASYTVFSNVTTGGFAFAGITGYDTLNYSAAVAQSGSDYVLSFTAIPEPGSVGLLASAAAVFAGGRRFRGRRPLAGTSSL